MDQQGRQCRFYQQRPAHPTARHFPFQQPGKAQAISAALVQGHGGGIAEQVGQPGLPPRQAAQDGIDEGDDVPLAGGIPGKSMHFTRRDQQQARGGKALPLPAGQQLATAAGNDEDMVQVGMGMRLDLPTIGLTAPFQGFGVDEMFICLGLCLPVQEEAGHGIAGFSDHAVQHGKVAMKNPIF